MDYNKYSKDVHTIIDNLSKKERNYIGNGYFVDSNHIIYRKIEYVGNKPVGFIDVYSLPKFKNYGLIIIAVSKDVRGKGVGKKLVNSAIQNCKNNKDINKLRWLADSDNIASIDLAKSLGFKLNSDGEDKKEFIYDLKNNKFITEASTALYAGVGTLLMSCLVYEKLIKSTNKHDKIKFKMEKIKNDLKNKETSYKCKSKNEVSKDFEILYDDAENILKSNLKEVADLYIKAYNESNFKKEYGKYFKIFPQKYDTEYTLTYKKNETRCMYSIFLNVATISVNNPDEDVVSKIMDEADEILDIYSKKRNKLKIDHDIDIEEQSTWDNNGCDKNIYLSYYIWLKPKSNTDMYKETTGYDKYSNDIHMIIDNLSKRDRSYIGSDYWLTADYIVYRNVEYDNGVPIGFIDLHQNPNSKGFAVMTIAINKELCSKNIDKKLIYSAMEFCKNNGIYELRWLVGSDDTYKFNLARSLNFELLYNIDDERCFIYDINNFNSSEISMESVIFSTDNIEYNTDTLKPNSDNNILFITGFSGSGKSTLMANLKEKYGNNIITIAGDIFFMVCVYKYRMANTTTELKGVNRFDISRESSKLYIGPVLKRYFDIYYKDINLSNGKFSNKELFVYWEHFINWLYNDVKENTSLYRNKIIVVEGIQIYVTNPELYKDHALIITGTSMLKSYFRKAKRDIISDRKYDWKHIKTLFTMIPVYLNDISNLNRLKRTMSESCDNINMFDETSLTEACKDINTARKFLQEVDNLSKKYDANFFIVTDGASMTRNGRGKSEPAVKNARDNQIEWEKKNGGNPDEDWLKHINESTLSSKERSKLDDDIFGIPSLRKYPLNDKAHVLAAIRMFNRVDRKHEKELAHNIITAMEKYKISTDIIGPKNRLQTYI